MQVLEVELADLYATENVSVLYIRVKSKIPLNALLHYVSYKIYYDNKICKDSIDVFTFSSRLIYDETIPMRAGLGRSYYLTKVKSVQVEVGIGWFPIRFRVDRKTYTREEVLDLLK